MINVWDSFYLMGMRIIPNFWLLLNVPARAHVVAVVLVAQCW